MQPAIISFAPAMAGLLCATLAAAAEKDCGALFEKARATDLTLSYQEFDQTQGQGFRTLAVQGCSREAADLIEAYIAATGATEHSLRWHIAQLRAEHGDYASAIDYARRSLAKTEDFQVRPLRWNDYVLAVIAFLEGDRQALIEHRDKVAAGVDAFWGNELNLKILDALIANFGLSYSEAIERMKK